MLVTSIFLLFPQFSTLPKQISIFQLHFPQGRHFVVIMMNSNPLPDEKILDWSKWKGILDDILECI